MRQRRYPDRICNISDADFWSSLRVLPERAGSDHLARAITLGQAGKQAEALAALAAYHRLALASEWEYRRAEICAHGSDQVSGGQSAEDLLSHRIDTWQGTIIQFGEEIDWNCPQTDLYGFHYLGWLSPGIHRLVTTGDPVFRDFFIRTIDSYYRARNSLTHTIPHAHPVYYELGSWAKINQLLPVYLALLHGGDLPTETHDALLKLFLGFARSLWREQRGYRAGNWQIVGCSGLLTLARLFPEFTERAAWERRALHYLLAHAREDFYSDGCHRERCWGYGHMSLNGLVTAYEVAKRHGGLGDEEHELRRRIRQAFRWFAKTLGPNELKPAYGDCKLYSGSAIIDAARPFFPGTGRNLGVDRTSSYYLKPSGYAVMRNGDAPDSAYLNVSFGYVPFWHAHQDTLNMNFWAQGVPLIEEVGRFGGYGEPLTLLFRMPESHNLLTIDGMHFDNKDAANRVGRDPYWFSTPEIDFFTAWHQAYRAQPLEPQSIDAVIRRTIIFVKDPGYALVYDAAWSIVPGAQGPEFSITQHWHSPFPFQTLSSNSARIASDRSCLLAFAPSAHLRRLEPGIDFAGNEATGQGDYPERYHLRARAWLDVTSRGACGVATVLYPFQGEQPEVELTSLPLDGARPYRAGAFQVSTPRGTDVMVINPEKLAGVACAGHGQVSLGNRRGIVMIP